MTYDPWNLLDKEFKSHHCIDKKSKVFIYDHTGYIECVCDCGEKYVHDWGCYGKPEHWPISEGAFK